MIKFLAIVIGFVISWIVGYAEYRRAKRAGDERAVALGFSHSSLSLLGWMALIMVLYWLGLYPD